MAEWTYGTADWLDADWCARARLPCRSFDHQIHARRGCAPSAPHAKPRRHGVDAVITARKEHVAGCDRSGDQQGNAVVDRFRGAIADHQPHTLSSLAKACGDRQDERFDRIRWLARRVGHYARHDCGSIETFSDAESN